MSSSYFQIIDASSEFYKAASEMAELSDTQMYILLSPWIDQQFHYDYQGVWALLRPGYPITFVREKNASKEDFEDYIEDFKEDLGHIVSKYSFSEMLGRRRQWTKLFYEIEDDEITFDEYLLKNKISGVDARKVEIMISLLIGSINQARAISLNEPKNLLDRIKNKIILFDTDQIRFLYQNPSDQERIIRIQGLAGTGKTELLLHKIKDLYLNFPDYVIGLTCHNRVLADVLRQRLVSFFNDMGVNRQIDPEKLKCFHAWGSLNEPNSGTLRYICYFYDLPFYSLRDAGTFNNACERTIINLQHSENFKCGEKAFDYLFVDESQDFPKSFFRLCDMVTDKHVFTAGDIFQNIFTISQKDLSEPVQILLNKCYRTDPRTFMFAHGMGMGLFERQKNTWLTDENWKKCGYQIEKVNNGKSYRLSRLPVKRFEDIPADFQSMKVFVSGNYMIPLIRVIERWREDYSSLTPDDIGIIFIDEKSYIYTEAQKIADYLNRKYGWEANLAFTSKKRKPGQVFISNRNNVKGLEFPFVVCLTHEIQDSMYYRHTLYTMLSRSHLQSILIVGSMPKDLNERLNHAANEIMSAGKMTVNVPTEDEMRHIENLALETQKLKLSIEERIDSICRTLQIPTSHWINIKQFILGLNDKDLLGEAELKDRIVRLWDMSK